MELSKVYDRISPGKEVMRGSEKVGVYHDPRKSDIERISVMVSQPNSKKPRYKYGGNRGVGYGSQVVTS